MVKIQQNEALDLELYMDYNTFTVYMSKGNKKVAEWKNMSLAEINGIVATYFQKK